MRPETDPIIDNNFRRPIDQLLLSIFETKSPEFGTKFGPE